MPRQSVRVEGLSELNEALIGLRNEFNLSRASAKNIVKRALKDASQPIAEEARRLAPRDTGALAESIEITDKLSRRQKARHKQESGVELFVGARALPHAHLQEFGTAFHGAQPFLRPAFDNNKMTVLSRITKSLASQIEKARKRLARKAEREALKIRAGT